jgi:single-stranded DNA-binding protein
MALEEENQGKIYTTFVDVICYGKIADQCQYLQKDTQVIVSGKLFSKKKGEVYTLGVMANQVQTFELKEEPTKQDTTWQPEMTEQDIPF